jgi:diguanylate cyclase (GGDEF)-like protein
VNEALQVQSQAFAQQARHDALTGVLNRHGLGDELLRLGRAHSDELFPISIAFLDLDHFKAINDRLGHAAGDEVLKQLAQLLLQHVQRSDLVARWGGEEFLLLFPATPLADAAGIAERLRQEIEHQRWPHGLRLSASVGLAEWRACEDPSDAIARADQAMYRAKRRCRNRIEQQGTETEALRALA